MHYHIMWGSNTQDLPSTVLNFEDRTEAINKFIEIVKAVEGEENGPPPYEQVKLNGKTHYFRMVSATHKYILVYCDNECGKPEESYQPTLN